MTTSSRLPSSSRRPDKLGCGCALATILVYALWLGFIVAVVIIAAALALSFLGIIAL